MKIQSLRLDGAQSAFFSRQLDAILARTYDIQYPALKARQFIPTTADAPPGAMTVTYRQFDRVGRAKIISDNAKDIPRMDITGQEFTRPVRTVAGMFAYSIDEVRAAAMAGFPLTERKAMATRRAIEEKLDDIAALGDATFGIATGFLNDANINATNAANPGGGTAWSTKTADQIITDVATSIGRIRTATEDTEQPDTIILPPAQHARIATMPRSTNSDTTVLQFLLNSFPTITTIASWNKLTGAGSGPSDRMVIYRRSPEVLSQEIPVEFTIEPPQEVGLEFQVFATARTAGTAVYQPLACDFTDAI